MDESTAWKKIVGCLDEAQQKLVKRFVLNGVIRGEAPAVLWIHGPAASRKSALVQAISTVGSAIVIAGSDLERGGFALAPLYKYVSGNSVASLLIIRAGRLGEGFSDLLHELKALIAGEAVCVAEKHKTPLPWNCDLSILFVSDLPPPEGLARCVAALEMNGTKLHIPAKVFTAVMGRAIGKWALVPN